ncbi:restriction endonuclease subunit S [Flavobacterium sp.]|uniref:restriction endonuclease subunit S n=1 Tax=Flavobacterium sp. TaxID=239 RepID=UPI00352875B4
MSLMRIDDLFHFEKGSLQSSKCTEGEFDFITASSEWKTHNEYTHDCEALVFAAAASGSLGRTHYVNGKFIASDLCFIITPKNQNELPIDLKFYHMIFNEFKDDIVKNTKAGTSKEAIGLKAFGNYKLPYFDIDKQVEAKIQFVNMQESKVELNIELTHQLDLIKQLRQAFLREAMQGKLLTPVTSSGVEKQETGHDLLAKIKAEKAQLIAAKKLKKEKELPPITEDEIPFEIPEHWAWCRLGEICSIKGGKRVPNGYKLLKEPTPYIYIRVSDMKNGTISDNDLHYIDKYVYHGIKQYTIGKDDIYMTIVGGTIGKCGLVPEKFDNMNLTENAAKITPILVDKKFLWKCLDSPFCQSQFIDKTKQVGVQKMALNRFSSSFIPLPPLHEQEQIVAKLEELLAFCDGLEESIKESQGYNEKLLQQVLREALKGEKTEIHA